MATAAKRKTTATGSRARGAAKDSGRASAAKTARGKAAPAASSRAGATGIRDESVREKTGKGWQQWFAILDEAGAASKPHKEIAAWLHDNHAISGWWSQMVTVAYERERGLREVHQKCEGDFEVSVSRTMGVELATLYQAWSQARQRKRWLGDPDFEVRKATRDKSMRITWVDGTTHVDVHFYGKGDTKSQVTVQHRKLMAASDVDVKRAYWAEQLGRLKALLQQQ